MLHLGLLYRYRDFRAVDGWNKNRMQGIRCFSLVKICRLCHLIGRTIFLTSEKPSSVRCDWLVFCWNLTWASCVQDGFCKHGRRSMSDFRKVFGVLLSIVRRTTHENVLKGFLKWFKRALKVNSSLNVLTFKNIWIYFAIWWEFREVSFVNKF